MVDRRRWLTWMAGTVAAASWLAHAQPKSPTWWIGYFGNGLAPPDGAPPAALRQALRDRGYVEGANIAFVSRWGELKPERLPMLAQELAALKPAVIVALGYPAAEAARQASGTIPIVISNAGDPDVMGLVSSLARPGGNVTGISDQSALLSAKRLELLKQLRPNANRIAVLWNVQNQAMTSRYHEIERAAGALGVSVKPLGVRQPEDFDAAFAALKGEHPDALLVVTDALTAANQNRVIDFSARNDVPAIYEVSSIVRNGGLMSYGPKPDDVWQHVADYVDRILKGAKPADLPVWQPTEFELLINMRAAKALGIDIPQSLFVRADEVIR